MKIYLNKAFLINFLLNLDLEDELHFFVNRLLKSGSSGVQLFIDFDFEEAYHDNSIRPLIRHIAQKLPVSDSTFLDSCQRSSFHNDDQARLFLLDDLPHLQLDKQFGCLIADSKTLNKIEFLFYSEDMRLNRSYNDWSLLKKFKHPCNTLVITDNYLAINDRKYENLFDILRKLLPETLDKDLRFHLTLIGHPKYAPDSALRRLPSIQDQQRTIKNFLNNNFPYPIDLTLIREDHHARCIFTNYLRISCEKGFALFNNGKISQKNQTTILTHSVVNLGRYSATQVTRMEELEECNRINRTERMPEFISGSRKNRLLASPQIT
jgi:hypothetical protein